MVTARFSSKENEETYLELIEGQGFVTLEIGDDIGNHDILMDVRTVTHLHHILGLWLAEQVRAAEVART